MIWDYHNNGHYWYTATADRAFSARITYSSRTGAYHVDYMQTGCDFWVGGVRPTLSEACAMAEATLRELVSQHGRGLSGYTPAQQTRALDRLAADVAKA